MTRPHVGLPVLRGDLERYAKRFDLVELHPGDAGTPKPSTLRSWRKKVPPSFVFSIVLPPVVGELRPSPSMDAALDQALEVARTVEARCIVVATPPSITPTDVNRKRLAALGDRIPHDAVTLAWEPHGVWELEEAAKLAAKLKMVLVVDAAREPAPAGPVVYFRLRGLGESTDLGPSAIEKVAAALHDRREAYVVIESSSPEGVADALRRSAARRPAATRAPSGVVRPRAMLRAEDEEQ